MWVGSMRDRCRLDEGEIGEGSMCAAMWGGYRLKNEQTREEGQ